MFLIVLTFKNFILPPFLFLDPTHHDRSPVPRDDVAKEHTMKQNAAAFRPQEDLGVFDVKTSKIK